MFNLFGKNDWYPVWAKTQRITINYQLPNFDGTFYHEKETAFANYEIEFSPSRKQYKLNISGYNPKSVNMYETSVQKLNEFIKNGHE